MQPLKVDADLKGTFLNHR